MALKTEVVDRSSRYTGRVKLTPWGGSDSQAVQYKLVRDDDPLVEGTKINKALLDQKAYTLTSNVTLYVSESGNDATGQGTSALPYKTIQKAIDELPKCLGGYHATIDIAAGDYEEAIVINGFYCGYLTIGVASRDTTVYGITITSSDDVRINIAKVKRLSSKSPPDLIRAEYGSVVTIESNVIIHGESSPVSGLVAANGSLISSGATIEVRGCQSSAVHASSGARIAIGTIAGTSANTSYAIRATMGGVVSFSSQTLTASLGNSTATGGRILTSSGTSLADASVV